MNSSLPLVLSSLSLVACGADGEVRSGAQLLELETTIQNGSNTTIERLDVRYEGSHLKEIARHANGAPAGSASFTYGAGGIASVEYADAEGDRATERLTYEGSRLVRARYEIAGIRVEERTISYDPARSGAPKEISTVTTSPGFGNSTSFVRYEYDAAGRTTKQLELVGSQNESTELRYTADGSLERASLFDDGAHRETYTFELDADARLVEVVDSRNGRHEVTYDDAGRVAEIRWSRSSGTTTYRYRYGEGSVDGWTFAPAVPVAQLFDLTGNAYGTVSLLHGDFAIPDDLPRSVNPDPEPDPDPDPEPTCGFTPVDACDTCLAASCCSEAEVCLAGSLCDSYIECASACTTAECQTVCGETNPTGRNDLQNLASCAQAFCPTSCQ
jgi:YD repeat-containing protein